MKCRYIIVTPASEWKNGLAWVIIGGLLSSLVLTVFLVPLVYYVVDIIKSKVNP